MQPEKHQFLGNYFGFGDLPQTIDQLLQTCPTTPAMNAIRKDFDIKIDSKLKLIPLCIEGGKHTPGILLSIYNVFRALHLLQFSQPIPLLKTTNVYAWLYKVKPHIKITLGEGYAHSNTKKRTIFIPSEILGQPWQRYWVDPQGHMGLMSFASLLVHETRHLQGYKHISGQMQDISLNYGGAWAAQLWFLRWCSKYSKNYLTDHARDEAQLQVNDIWPARFKYRWTKKKG